MKKGSTLFLKIVIVLIGATVLGACIFVLPGIIGSIEMGGYDPILIGMYLTAIPFFIALYQYCAITISALYALGMPYIFHVADLDDAPGVVAIGLVIVFASFVIAVFAAVLQKLLKNAIDIKSEHDLTV